MRAGERRILGFVVAAALVPPAVAGIAGVVLRPRDVPPLMALALVVLAAGGLVAVRGAGPRRAGWLLSLAVVAVAVLWPEVGLRVAGFRFDPRQVIQFGWPKPHQMVELESDPQLFWKLPTSQDWVNSHGFKGAEFEVPKPRGRWRMVFFGDSCTQLGIPELVASYLRSQPASPPDLDAVNLGVVGYSSYQGRVLVERWTKPLEPDLAVIYFGWNDHWRAYGGTDSEKGARVLKPYVALSPVLASSRVVQWVASRVSGGSPEPTEKMRVPIEEYRDNLVAMGQRLERAGSRVLLVTAPTSYATLGVPDWIIDHKFAVDKRQALELHRRYNQVVRNVARDHGWLLLDLEALAERLPQPDKVFTKDGIHFTKRGVMWVSRTIGDEILKYVLEPGGAGAGVPAAGRSRPGRTSDSGRAGG